ncbi:MAG: transcriptional repressor, partial [Lewinella sp.]|nr:transcriptional repressor [Lewinella sp.]
MTSRSITILQQHGLRITAIRDKVLQIFLEAGHRALSNADIEKHFDRLDRITLYRTLRTFEEKGLIHQVIDNSGTPKFATCSEHCAEHDHHDDHAHFHCVKCEKTVCLEDTTLPDVKIPVGFKVEEKHM